MLIKFRPGKNGSHRLDMQCFFIIQCFVAICEFYYIF
jgi:hypothetical protein